MKNIYYFFSLFFLLLIVSGCSPTPEQKPAAPEITVIPVSPQANLTPAASGEILKAYASSPKKSIVVEKSAEKAVNSLDASAQKLVTGGTAKEPNYVEFVEDSGNRALLTYCSTPVGCPVLIIMRKVNNTWDVEREIDMRTNTTGFDPTKDDWATYDFK
ncbi:MAG: hypothetical protein WCP97_01785 [bacterium]